MSLAIRIGGLAVGSSGGSSPFRIFSGLVGYWRHYDNTGQWVLNYTEDGGLTWTNLDSLDPSEDTILRNSTYRYRIVDYALHVDQKLTPTGYAGTEGTDWENLGVFNGWIGNYPFRSDILAGGDGTILLIGSDYFLKDLKNGKNLLITGYDFPTTWTKGFPYKSAATISAPTGDADFIAADLNNFWYAGDGTPNQIPVVSLFQDIDYEHKFFFKHAAQILDANSVEIYEPRVIEWAVYSTVKAGADITTAQTYFGATAEDAVATWVDPVNGVDIAAGTKAAPLLTLTHGLTHAPALIYQESGTHDANNTNYSIAKNITGLGFVKFSNLRVSYMALVSGNITIKGWIIDNVLGTYPLYVHGTYTPTFDKVAILNYQYASNLVTGATGGNFTNCVILSRATTANTFACAKKYLTVDTCLIKDASLSTFYDNYATGGIELVVKHCKIISTGTNFLNTINNHALVDIIDNIIAIPQTLLNNVDITTFNFKRNVGIMGYISGGGTGTGNYNIDNNIVSGSDANAFFTLGNKNSYIKKNIINISSTGAFLLHDSSGAVVVEIEGNKLIATGDATGLTIGVGANINTITGYYKNNYMIQKKANPVNGHGIQNYGHDGFIISQNRAKGVPLPYIFKGDSHDCSNSSINNNIAVNGKIVVKGVENLNVSNNTAVNHAGQDHPCIDILINVTGTVENNVIKNCIFISENNSAASHLVLIENAITVITFDYNIYYSPMAKPFKYNNTEYSWVDWKALGHDAHSIMLTTMAEVRALFTDYDNEDFTLKTGSVAIGGWADLGEGYQDGLDALTNWGSDSQLPVVVTKTQGASKDCGAYIH